MEVEGGGHNKQIRARRHTKAIYLSFCLGQMTFIGSQGWFKMENQILNDAKCVT